MSQTPSAAPYSPGLGGGAGGWGTGGDGGDFALDDRPSRLSALAVSSLVFSLLCLLPGSGAIGIMLGAAAAIVINASAGRLRGMGLAIAGVVVGVFTSVVWILILVGTVKLVQVANRDYFAPVGSAVTVLQTGTNDQFRATVPGAVRSAGDEPINAFRTALRSELGAFQGAPTSLLDLCLALWQGKSDLQAFEQFQNIVPMPASFEKGRGWLLLEIDPPAGKKTKEVPLLNVGFWSPRTGAEVWLLDHKRVTAPPGQRTQGTGSPASSPASPQQQPPPAPAGQPEQTDTPPAPAAPAPAGGG